jgi:hypothetical protein
MAELRRGLQQITAANIEAAIDSLTEANPGCFDIGDALGWPEELLGPDGMDDLAELDYHLSDRFGRGRGWTGEERAGIDIGVRAACIVLWKIATLEDEPLRGGLPSLEPEEPSA